MNILALKSGRDSSILDMFSIILELGQGSKICGPALCPLYEDT